TSAMRPLPSGIDTIARGWVSPLATSCSFTLTSALAGAASEATAPAARQAYFTINRMLVPSKGSGRSFISKSCDYRKQTKLSNDRQHLCLSRIGLSTPCLLDNRDISDGT